MLGERLIHMSGLSKVFTEGRSLRTALCDIDLTIARGEYVAVAGPSGGGKSTLLSIMGLLEPQTTGRYMFAGDDVSQMGLAARARLRNQKIGFIFQSFNLIGDLSVAKNIELPLTYRPGMSSRQRKVRINQMLERFELGQRQHDLPTQLSGGEQQRVAIARALVGSPSIILADEPTGNLDSGQAAMVMGILKELHTEGATVCLATHDVRFEHHADRLLSLSDGALWELKRIWDSSSIA